MFSSCGRRTPSFPSHRVQVRAQLKQDALWILSHATVIAVYFLAIAGETNVRREKKKKSLPDRKRDEDGSVFGNIACSCAPNTPDTPC